jgi:ankyrin repeat protein
MKATMDIENELLEVEQLQPVASQLWRSYASKALSLAFKNRVRFDREPIVAFQVAISNCCELGVEFNEAELLAWAYTAAKSGHNHAMWMAPLLEDSCRSTYGDRDFRKACLVIGACIGSIPSLRALERTDRILYDSTLTAIRSKRRPDFENDTPTTFELFMRFSEAPSLALSTCNLIDALGSHNVEEARKILEMSSTDVTNMTDELGRNILHMLTYLRDEDTEGLALLAYVQGASLEQVSASSESTHSFLYNRQISGTPMCWAALKGMSCLVKQLLELHEESGIAFEGFDEIILSVAFLHHFEVLRLIISQLKRTPELMVNRSPYQDNQQLIQALLGAALTSVTNIPLSRRMLHGVDFDTAQSRTLNLLLDEGANPLLPCHGLTDTVFEQIDYDALSFAIANNDHASLALLLAKVRNSIDQSQVQEEMDGKLQFCVIQNSLSCLRVLLEIFPEIVNPPVTSSGVPQIPTPLNMAARHARPEYALALLDAHADITVWHKGFSPLARALIDGHLDTANAIYRFCSKEDIQRIFDYNETSGATMSGRLMAIWRTGRNRGKGLIGAMRWLHNKGGAYFNCYKDEQRPIWEEILFRRASSSAEQASLDNLMLETLFDMFPEELHQADADGLFPIHRATMNGHRYAVESLLDRSVNINVESVGSSDRTTPVPKGLTALCIAIQRLHRKAPFDIQKGGKVEVRRWRETMKDILELLLSREATIGEHASTIDFYRSLQYTVRNVHVSTPYDLDEDDELEWGEDVWPRRLPSDETSSQAAQEQGGRLIPPMMKSAMRTLLAPITSSRQDPQELLNDEEKENFAQYKAWLLTRVELRTVAYQQRSLDWNTVGRNEQTDGSSSWSPDWTRWHTLSSTRTAFYPHAVGMTENDTSQVSHTHNLGLLYD